MDKSKEKVFDYLKNNHGDPFSNEVKENWYKARSYVLEKLKDVAFRPDENCHLHIIIDVDANDKALSPLMLSVVRQVALSAHYINFREGDEEHESRNRTIITVVSRHASVREELKKEEYLNSLLEHCCHVDSNSEDARKDFYIDLELQIVKEYNDEEGLRFTEADVEDFCLKQQESGVDIYTIDTRMAVYASRMYSIGMAVDNLPAEDVHCASRYSQALDIFQYEKLKDDVEPMFNEDDHHKESYVVKERVSNVFCADCFVSRARSIRLLSNGDDKKEQELWGKNNEALSRSEHARWVAEKLILGYRPLNEEERYQDECLHVQFKNKEKKIKYRKELKSRENDPAHIDLCSYRDLRRINPDDLKYDSFLMLAIPKIMERVKADVR